MTLTRKPIPSPNYSSRGGVQVRLIVLHTAEGATTIESLGSYFANPASGVSSHTGIDDQPGVIGEYVRRPDKAWTAAQANPHSVQAELCAFASWDAAEWHRHPQMVDNCATWIAEESAHFGIPITALTAIQAQSGVAGVCQHVDLGAAGGGHWDCGPAFPMSHVIDLARGAPTPQPQPDWKDDNMVLTDPDTNGVWVVADKTGAIYNYDGAPFLGGTNNPALNPHGHPCVGISGFTDRHGPGYCLTLDWGDRGDGHSTDGGDRYRRYRFPRDGSARV
jgi:hypothetical protein